MRLERKGTLNKDINKKGATGGEKGVSRNRMSGQAEMRQGRKPFKQGCLGAGAVYWIKDKSK